MWGLNLPPRDQESTHSSDSLLLLWSPHLDTWVGCPLLPWQHVNVKSRCSMLRHCTVSLQVRWVEAVTYSSPATRHGIRGLVILVSMWFSHAFPLPFPLCVDSSCMALFSLEPLPNHAHLTALPIAIASPWYPSDTFLLSSQVSDPMWLFGGCLPWMHYLKWRGVGLITLFYLHYSSTC